MKVIVVPGKLVGIVAEVAATERRVRCLVFGAVYCGWDLGSHQPLWVDRLGTAKSSKFE